MYNGPVIDADGHVLEKEKYIRKYLEKPWDKRSTALRTRDQPWDANLFDSFEMAVRWEDLSPKQQIDEWHAVMDREGMEYAICFPTGSGNVSKLQELDFALAIARASNTQFAKEFNAHSNRVSCVGVLPLRDPKAAAEEMRRAVNELGLKGFEILPMGLPMALGSTFYDPVYAEAEKLGAVIGIHGSRSNSHELGAAKLSTFAEVHSYAFTVGLLLAVYPCGWSGRADSLPQLETGVLGDRRDLVALLFGPARRALGEARQARDAACSKKSPAIWCASRKCILASNPASRCCLSRSTISARNIFFMPRIFPTGTMSFPATCTRCAIIRASATPTRKRFCYSNAKQLFNI